MSVFFGSSNPADRRWTSRWVGPLPPNTQSPHIADTQPGGSNLLWRISLEDILSAIPVPPDDWQLVPTPTSTPTPTPPPPPPLHCGICFDDLHEPADLQIQGCEHTFCHPCLQQYATMQIREQRYPIKCPGCVATGETVNSFVEQEIFGPLRMSEKDREDFIELQLSAHAVTLRCPRRATVPRLSSHNLKDSGSCKASTRVDRQDYAATIVLSCPSPQCQYKWCRDCHKELDSSDINHKCTNKKLDRLMRKKGWKYCPGCRTPIQKASGCNHMTCESPGCGVHFCYRCGDLIFDPSSGGRLGDTITTHYDRCVQYPGMIPRLVTAIHRLNCIS